MNEHKFHQCPFLRLVHILIVVLIMNFVHFSGRQADALSCSPLLKGKNSRGKSSCRLGNPLYEATKVRNWGCTHYAVIS